MVGFRKFNFSEAFPGTSGAVDDKSRGDYSAEMSRLIDLIRTYRPTNIEKRIYVSIPEGAADKSAYIENVLHGLYDRHINVYYFWIGGNIDIRKSEPGSTAFIFFRELDCVENFPYVSVSEDGLDRAYGDFEKYGPLVVFYMSAHRDEIREKVQAPVIELTTSKHRDYLQISLLFSALIFALTLTSMFGFNVVYIINNSTQVSMPGYALFAFIILYFAFLIISLRRSNTRRLKFALVAVIFGILFAVSITVISENISFGGFTAVVYTFPSVSYLAVYSSSFLAAGMRRSDIAVYTVTTLMVIMSESFLIFPGLSSIGVHLPWNIVYIGPHSQITSGLIRSYVASVFVPLTEIIIIASYLALSVYLLFMRHLERKKTSHIA